MDFESYDCSDIDGFENELGAVASFIMPCNGGTKETDRNGTDRVELMPIKVFQDRFCLLDHNLKNKYID